MKTKQYKYQKPSKNLIITITSLWALSQVLLFFFFTDIVKNHLFDLDYLFLDLLLVCSSFIVYKLNLSYYKKTKFSYAHVRKF